MKEYSALQRVLAYFGLAEPPGGARPGAPAAERGRERDELLVRLEALERRLEDNTTAVEALRAEVMRLSAKL